MDFSRVRARRAATVVIAIAATAGLTGLPARAAPPGASPGGADTVTGVVQDVVVDNPGDDHGAEKIRKVLRVGDEIISLVDGSLATAKNGETLRVSLADGGGARRVLSAATVAPAPAATGDAAAPTVAATHDVYAVVVRPKDATGTAPSTSTVMTALGKAASYWSSQTGSKVNFRLKWVAPSYVSAYSCANGSNAVEQMWEEALKKIAIPKIPNQHLMIFAPYGADQIGCPYGLGSIGYWSGKPGLTFVSDTNQTVVGHELGHNLSLYHSNALHCGLTQDGSYSSSAGWPSSCYPEEYGDLFDVMGYGGENFGEGSLNAVHLTRMGHLPTAVRTIATGGTYTVRISPLSAAPTALRAVRILEPTGHSYYVEYRIKSGRDLMGTRNFLNPSYGVRVLRQNPDVSGSGSYTLDATPSWDFDYDYTNNVAVGKTLTSASRKITVRVAAADITGATLVITNAPSLPYRAELYGLPTAANAGTKLAAKVKVVNAYGQPVRNWAVTLQRYPVGGSTYGNLVSGRTDGNGVATLWFTHNVSGSFRAVTAGSASIPVKASNAIFVTARR